MSYKLNMIEEPTQELSAFGEWLAKVAPYYLRIAGPIIILFLAVLALNSRPLYRNDIYTIMNATLGLIGGLYLAYDFFHEKTLKLLTELVTYTLIGMSIFFLPAITVVFFNRSLALQILLVGGLLGGFGGLSVSKHGLGEGFFDEDWMTEIIASCIFCCSIVFVLAFPYLPEPHSIVVFLDVILIGLGIVIVLFLPLRLYRHFIVRRLPDRTRPSGWWFLAGFGLWFPLWFFSVWYLSDSWPLGLILAFILALISALSASTAGVTFFLVNLPQPTRKLGIIGLVFASAAIFLSCLPSIIHLLTQ